MKPRTEHVAGRKVGPHTYKNHKCRCEGCTKAWADYMGPKVDRWRKEQRNGRKA